MKYLWEIIILLVVFPGLCSDMPGMIRQVEEETLLVNADRQSSLTAGNTPPSLQIYGGSAAGSLIPESLKIKIGDRYLTAGKDYLVDPVWSKFVLTDSAGIPAGTAVQLAYQYRLRRIDSRIRNRDGSESILIGTPELNQAMPPELPEGAVRLANIFHDYSDTRNYPISEFSRKSGSTSGRIPRTLAKLQQGENVKIVCWGDSVTAGAEATPGNAYPAKLELALRQRFPNAGITVKVVAVPGSSSTHWLWPEQYPYGGADWQLVAAEKPDLIILEFVNDNGLSSSEAVISHYGEILRRIRELNAELILIAPHFTCPEMMSAFNAFHGRECRPYVKGLRKLAEQEQLGLADASQRWEDLEKQGIPYVTLLVNGINHPDDRGHQIFVEEVMHNFE